MMTLLLLLLSLCEAMPILLECFTGQLSYWLFFFALTSSTGTKVQIP